MRGDFRIDQTRMGDRQHVAGREDMARLGRRDRLGEPLDDALGQAGRQPRGHQQRRDADGRGCGAAALAVGEKLGLDEALRARAAAAANDVACLPGGGKPERYDFVKLVARLQERLPQLAKG